MENYMFFSIESAFKTDHVTFSEKWSRDFLVHKKIFHLIVYEL